MLGSQIKGERCCGFYESLDWEGDCRPLVAALVMVDMVDAEQRLGVDDRESLGLRAHCDNSSMGNGKMMVEFFSALIELSVWR